MRTKRDREAALWLLGSLGQVTNAEILNPSLRFYQAARTHWPAAEAELEEAAGLLRDIKETQTKLRPSLRKRLDTFLSTYDGGDDAK